MTFQTRVSKILKGLFLPKSILAWSYHPMRYCAPSCCNPAAEPGFFRILSSQFLAKIFIKEYLFLLFHKINEYLAFPHPTAAGIVGVFRCCNDYENWVRQLNRFIVTQLMHRCVFMDNVPAKLGIKHVPFRSRKRENHPIVALLVNHYRQRVQSCQKLFVKILKYIGELSFCSHLAANLMVLADRSTFYCGH